MAHTNQSSVITTIDSTPITKVNALIKGGRVRSAYGYLTLAPATAGQTNAFVRVPVRARLKDVKLKHAAFGNGAVDLGLHRPEDGIAITSDGLAADIELDSARGTAIVDLATAVADREKDLATLFATEIGTAGATEDVEVDLVLTVATVSTGAATAVGMEVEYVLPD